MNAAIQERSAAQIQARLSELDGELRAFKSRDLVGEMAGAMAGGADVDGLEAAQLDAERHHRRLEAERQALSRLLPEARQREAQAAVELLRPEWEASRKQAVAAAAELEKLVPKVLAEAEILAAAVTESEAVTYRAFQTLGKGADRPDGFGQLHSPQTATLLADLRKATARATLVSGCYSNIATASIDRPE